MFSFGKKKSDKPDNDSFNPLDVKAMAETFVTTVTKASLLVNVKDNSGNPSVYAQLAGISPKDLVTTYVIQLRILDNMKNELTRSEKLLGVTMDYIRDHQKRGLPEEEANKMRTSAEELVQLLRDEIAAITRFNSKLQNLVHVVADEHEIERVSSELRMTCK